MRLKLSALLTLTAILGGILYAQEAWWRQPNASVRMAAQVEKTRSAAPPAIQVPLRGVDVQQVDWGQLAAMIAVMSAIAGGFQWIITRAIVQPSIAKEVKDAVMSMQHWAANEFTSKNEFQLHAQDDRHFHGEIGRLIDNQDADRQRLSELRDKVLVMEAQQDES